MAYSADGYQFSAASPIMSSGIDPEALLAMDPDAVAKAKAMGLPVGQAGATGRPVGTNTPQPSGTSANQQTQQTPLANPNQPATPGGMSQLAAAAAPTVPAAVSPTGKPETPVNPNNVKEGVPSQTTAPSAL